MNERVSGVPRSWFQLDVGEIGYPLLEVALKAMELELRVVRVEVKEFFEKAEKAREERQIHEFRFWAHGAGEADVWREELEGAIAKLRPAIEERVAEKDRRRPLTGEFTVLLD